MSAESGQVATEIWRRWEGQVLNGVFPLRRFLGGSDQAAVFLSEYEAGKLPEVAIKFVPAVAAEAQLAQWRTAAALSHPHLVRIFDMDRCQLGGRELLFVVMEYGEQTLAQFLAQRALTAGEVRALLLPTLDALAFLHHNQLVHAQLKPSNLLIVNDQLKLSSDSVRQPRRSGSGSIRKSRYDAPELDDRGVSAAGDIWSLGVTLAEAFTQRTPASSDEQFEMSSLLANVPAPFASAVRQCLDPSPASRPTVVELLVQYRSARRRQVTSDPQPQESAPKATTSPRFPTRHQVLLAMAAVLLVTLVVWLVPERSGNSQVDLQPPPAVAAPTPTPTPTPTQPDVKRSGTVSRTPPFVLVEVKPDVPRDMRDKIQGRILVTVRVLVDSSGNVIGALMENPGPSKSLASLAEEAAREWKFAASEDQPTRVWIVTFEFTRGEVTARATAV